MKLGGEVVHDLFDFFSPWIDPGLSFRAFLYPYDSPLVSVCSIAKNQILSLLEDISSFSMQC